MFDDVKRFVMIVLLPSRTKIIVSSMDETELPLQIRFRRVPGLPNREVTIGELSTCPFLKYAR